MCLGRNNTDRRCMHMYKKSYSSNITSTCYLYNYLDTRAAYTVYAPTHMNRNLCIKLPEVQQLKMKEVLVL